MSNHSERLDQFRYEVNLYIALSDTDDLVTNDHGDCPVIVALDDEPMSTVLGRIRAAGGYGTIFSKGTAIRVVSFIRADSAIADPSDELVPGGSAPFGMFLDFAETRPDGVAIPAAFSHPAKATDTRHIELAA